MLLTDAACRPIHRKKLELIDTYSIVENDDALVLGLPSGQLGLCVSFDFDHLIGMREVDEYAFDTQKCVF